MKEELLGPWALNWEYNDCILGNTINNIIKEIEICSNPKIISRMPMILYLIIEIV